jgi:uncharacterized protein (TIGR03437 family)
VAGDGADVCRSQWSSSGFQRGGPRQPCYFCSKVHISASFGLSLHEKCSRFLLFCLLVQPQAVAQITLDPLPSRVIGQNSIQVSNVNPNLVEGREFFAPEAVALDMSTNPPGLYVADAGNNRVLGFRNAAGFANGQKADVVIGQPDFATTLPLAASSTSTNASAGLSSPTGLAVDASGNLYVVDSGNNRILRYAAPFAQTGSQIPDLVIGQPGFITNSPNQGGISASTLAFSMSSVLQAYIAFDSSGNLWVADAGNNRVLRYNAKVLGAQAAPGPAADLVLGQFDFTTNTYNPPGNPSTSVSAILAPTGIAFDAGGRLFVAESSGTRRGRILVFNPPLGTGQFASRLLGVNNTTPAPPAINQFQLGVGPGNLFALGNQIGIADPANNRLLIFPPADQWTSNTLFQAATLVIGQPDFASGAADQGQPEAGPSTLSGPAAAVFSGSELFVADTLNHRVVVLPGDATGFGPATRVLGQDALDLNTENRIEGREFDFSGTNTGGDAGIAVDLNSNPPHLYIADTWNNRILGYNDLRNIQSGAKADLVIGQPDFRHSLVNYPSNSATQPNQSGLSSPTGLLVDDDGNLYVADSGNGRVLRFPKPFANYTPGAMQPADLVLGQPDFTGRIRDATARTMAAPYGLAMTLYPGLMVSDAVHSRVLFFQGASQSFTSGQAATLVFGQKDFNSSGAGTGSGQMNSPHHIATDSDDRLYVADTGNGRVLIFNHAPSAGSNPQAAVILRSGLSSPRGIYIHPVNGEIWVTDFNANAAIRYPAFNTLELSADNAPNGSLTEYRPLAVTEDSWGNLLVADFANRVVIHYAGLSALNAANYLFSNALAPGMIAALYTSGNLHQFGDTAQNNSGALPLPRQLNGIEVLFNGSPVPLFYAGTDQINFQVPISAPQSGTAELLVQEVATGRIMGAATVSMTPSIPGIFTQAANGSGAAVAANEDGTLNSQTNPAIAGHIITLYGTGQGFIDGAPPDGNVAGKPLPTAQPPTVFIGAHLQSGDAIKYAGLAPTLVGVWQLNVVIPSDTITLPNNPTVVLAIQGKIPSGNATRVVQIYVKQP